MNTKDTLALLAGLGTGYIQQGDKERQRGIEQANIDWQNNLRQRDQAAYDLAQKQRGDLVAAAAPVAAAPDVDTASTGTDPTAAPNAQTLPAGGGSGFGGVGSDPSAQPAPVVSTFSVGDTHGMSQANAVAAAAQQNTPTAQMARMAGALRVNGDPVAAAQLEAQARQSQLGQIQLDAATRQQHQQAFNDQLLGALPGGHAAIADFISKSDGDGQGGALQAKAVPSADGKSVTYQFTGADGTTTTGPTFSNDKQGAVEAAFMLQKGMTPEMLVAHNEGLTKDKREQQLADQTGAYQQGMLKNNAERIQLMGEAAQARAEAAASRAAAAAQNAKDPVLQAELGMTGKMLEQASEQINKIYSADGYDPLKPPAGLTKLQSQQALLQQKILDLTAGRAHPGGVPSVFNAPPPPQPTGTAAAVAAAPPGSWTNPNAPAAPPGAPSTNFDADAARAARENPPNPPNPVDAARAAQAVQQAAVARAMLEGGSTRPVATMAPPVVAAPARALTPAQQAIVNGLPYSMRASAIQRYSAGAQ